jgi:hypothetical protein
MTAPQAQFEARLGRGYYAYNQGITGLRGRPTRATPGSSALSTTNRTPTSVA